ncbi:AbrB/MazE/SpoVT family DNA-binding domain-containing protein [Pyrobaculum aerophilum]|uniref:AbrB/MazE/SpoVT family DNA-binding domain-containing protein n=1 Tax=Pyrobaculum aerophilum TaxID=13773 RepID=UPI0023F112E4|nr:AbrB/MazE/SpoVT family DNA-binding domain-containing protein [Pyrobaculum aerophilum]MCX8137557.1 AbrB/MazE/SpoVT family DNA-binding domain-containing protein [Pyrobaculum aerophilum]
MEIVEVDGSGRIYLPAEIRKRIGARRFRVKIVDNGILLEPVDDVDKYYGKFGPPRYKSLEDIEEAIRDVSQVDLR